MAQKSIRGRIIRILDASTVIVNLGKVDGVTSSNMFSIIAEPENIVDPETKEVLGTVSIVKGKLKVQSVSDKFSICTSKWTEYQSATDELWGAIARPYILRGTKVDEGTELRVSPKEVKPWRAVSEDIVKVGDQVETVVSQQEKSLPEQETSPVVAPPSTDAS